MDKIKLFFASLVTLFSCIFCYAGSTAFASGFGIFTQGASALGQANSVVAHVDGPSAVFFNPALINRLPGTQIEIGTTLIFPNREFKNSAGATTSTKDSLFYPSTFYLTHTFNDKISVGLGIFNPFGLGTDWGDEWEGRYISTDAELQTFNINPVASYRITPSLSVAAGLDIILLDATLKSKVPSALLGIPGPSFDVAQKFKGSGNGIGYNVGIYYEISDVISIGASYRSKVKIDANGDLSLSVFPQSIDGKTTITLPQQLSAGLAFKASDRLTVETGMRWEDWTSFDQLKIDITGQPSAISPRDWHSTFAVNAGGKYRVNETFSMMAGYLYGWNPVPDNTFDPSIPDANSHLFSVGGEAHLDQLTITLAYAYQLQYDRTKTINQYGPIANGTYSSDLHLLGVSLGYRF